MKASHRNKTASAINTVMMAAVLITVTSMLPQPAFAKKFTQIGEDMGKCMQKFTGSQSFKDKMCACKDSACAQLTGDYQLVLMRSSTSTENDAGSVQQVN